MKRVQFLEQLQAAGMLTDEEAQQEQIALESAGQQPVIRFIPTSHGEAPFNSFWVDVGGKARVTDEIAPIFFETEKGAVRGIALWRRIPESCYTDS